MQNHRLKTWSTRTLRFARLGSIAILLQLSACADRPLVADAEAQTRYSPSISECLESLAAIAPGGDELDASSIRLFNWNVRKSRSPRWREDFEAYADGADLVLFQEASIREESIGELDANRHWSFAPGYSRPGEVTGVMTLSAIRPLTQCNLVHYEPWLQTSKATSITEYGLQGTSQTLVVVNVHAVNFSFGTEAFQKQFEEIRQVLETHDGPIILSGDLNTWREKRTQIVEELADSLQLVAVNFDNDQRKRFFGSPLDHIYVRGLRAIESDTAIVDTSDHNPMTATLGM